MTFSKRGRLFVFEPGRFPVRSSADELLLHVWEECKSGRFEVSGKLIDVIKGSTSTSTTYSAFALVPYVVPRPIVLDLGRELAESFWGDDDYMEALCISLAATGLIDAIDLSAAFTGRFSADYSYSDLAYHFSIVLEENAGDVFLGPRPIIGEVDEFESAPVEYESEAYRQLLTEKTGAIKRKSGEWRSAAFIFGKMVNLESLALRILHELPIHSDNEDLVAVRCLLEAFTGFDLSDFYSKMHLNRVAAAASIERLFDSVDLSGYETGRRYFFGYPIGD